MNLFHRRPSTPSPLLDIACWKAEGELRGHKEARDNLRGFQAHAGFQVLSAGCQLMLFAILQSLSCLKWARCFTRASAAVQGVLQSLDLPLLSCFQ